jgi:hypothetical protein
MIEYHASETQKLALKVQIIKIRTNKVYKQERLENAHRYETSCIELYRPIFQFIFDRSDLCALLYVCRTFRHEAERVLYEIVDLKYNHLKIYLWCKTAASSPLLSSLVKSLTFGIVPSQPPTPVLRWLRVIATGLTSLINLTEYVHSYRCWTTLQNNP